MDGETTKLSGWGVGIFLLGFTVLAGAAIGGGALSLIGGAALLIVSALVFKAAREKETV